MVSVEIVYSYLIDSAIIFLGSWVVFLLAASTRVFGGDTRPQKG